MQIRIEGGHTLVNGRLEETTVDVDTAEGGTVKAIGADIATTRRLSAKDLFVLPGIVDIHGDAFERQVMPRPGVAFPIDIALLESDRQAIMNGITTLFHGVTWSWEPGLRGRDSAHELAAGIERLRPHLAADTRFHLRHETYNLEAEEEIIEWIERRRIDVLAFNDHMSMTVMDMKRPQKRDQMVQRSGLSLEEFNRLVERVQGCGGDVPGSIDRIASAARSASVPFLSHDDDSPNRRHHYRSLGSRISEFPTNAETAEAATAAGDFTVFGAPNVVRGGSHTGWTDATEMVRRGLCSILASDYYYPAPLLAAFHLAAKGIVPLEKAWVLVSQAPARAVGYNDRGEIAVGRRGDILLVNASDPTRPQIVATLVAGRLVYLSEAARLS